MREEKKTISVPVEGTDEYKTELHDKLTEAFGTDSEITLNENIVCGFTEALRELGHQNFEIIFKN